MNRYFNIVTVGVLCALGTQNAQAFWPSFLSAAPAVRVAQPVAPFQFVDTRSGDELIKAGLEKKKKELATSLRWYAAVLGSFYIGRQYQLVANQGISSLWSDRSGLIRATWSYMPLSVVCAGAVYGAYKIGLLSKLYRSVTGRPVQQSAEANL